MLKDTKSKGLINSSKNQLGLISNWLTELILVKSLASVGSLAKTNFLNVPSANLIELSDPLKLVIVLMLLFNLSTEFFKYYLLEQNPEKYKSLNLRH